jgi:hypothetical protein
VDGSAPRYLLGISQDVTEERSVEARLAYMAMHDALTGMPNRAFFSEQIRTLAAMATALNAADRPALSRCRSLQAHQRQQGACGRRCAAVPGGEAADVACRGG